MMLFLSSWHSLAHSKEKPRAKETMLTRARLLTFPALVRRHGNVEGTLRSGEGLGLSGGNQRKTCDDFVTLSGIQRGSGEHTQKIGGLAGTVTAELRKRYRSFRPLGPTDPEPLNSGVFALSCGLLGIWIRPSGRVLARYDWRSIQQHRENPAQIICFELSCRLR
jgi:hypothetical protein